MRPILFLFLSSLLIILPSFTKPQGKEGYKIKRIVIDAGHGGKDPGCLTSQNKEKDIALDIALKLGDVINTNMPDVQVIFTRSKDEFIELAERAGIANRHQADLFLSIHVNAAENKELHGTETFFMGLHKTEANLIVAQRENSSILMEKDSKTTYEGFDPNSPESYILFSLHQNAHIAQSMKLAEKIENEFQEANNRQSRGVKQAGFLVLWKTTMPAVLIETGFITNSKDETFLGSEDGRLETAFSIYAAIENFKLETESE